MVRVPARKVGERWEFFYGGEIPVQDGSVADIVLDPSSITDPVFLKRLTEKTSYKIMKPGVRLLVALTIRNQSEIDSKLRKYLKNLDIKQISKDKRFSPFGVRPNTRFVEITVGNRIGQQSLPLETDENDGVWLELEGMEPQGLKVGSLILPSEVAQDPVDSFNYAFTLLSTAYEPWRRSHTGNIYQRIFYQEENGIWHPLNVLRNAALATEEHAFIKRQWELIARQLNLKF